MEYLLIFFANHRTHMLPDISDVGIVLMKHLKSCLQGFQISITKYEDPPRWEKMTHEINNLAPIMSL